MAEPRDRKRGLGRGLSALMADVAEPSQQENRTAASPDLLVPIEQISPNPDQPRKVFDEDVLQDLAASIQEKGVIQPLIVRRKSDQQFEIVAGERRWRAAQLARKHEVPVIVRDFTDLEVLEVAIIENIQRADLSPIEEAAGYQQLMDRFGHTQEKVAGALGKSRSHIANLLRLLALPQDIQDMLRRGDLSAGHARALIPAQDPLALARQVVNQGLSVRATEALVKKERNQLNSGAAPSHRSKTVAEKDADTLALEGDLSATLRMPVRLQHEPGGESGKITITYKNLDQLDALCRLLSGS